MKLSDVQRTAYRQSLKNYESGASGNSAVFKARDDHVAGCSSSSGIVRPNGACAAQGVG